MDLPRDVSRSPSPSFDQGDGGGGLEVSFDRCVVSDGFVLMDQLHSIREHSSPAVLH